jgi:hypothetical protein
MSAHQRRRNSSCLPNTRTRRFPAGVGICRLGAARPDLNGPRAAAGGCADAEGRGGCGPPFGFRLDRCQRGRHRLLPAAGDQPAPPPAQAPQVGGQLPLVAQQRAGTIGLLLQRERLDHVGDRAADQPEVDPLGPGEAHRLHRLGNQPQPPPQRGDVGGQHHVAAAFQHTDLVGQRPRGPAQVGFGDEIEDGLATSSHLDQLGAEWPHPPADANIQRARPGHQADIARRRRAGCHGRRGQQPAAPTRHTTPSLRRGRHGWRVPGLLCAVQWPQPT